MFWVVQDNVFSEAGHEALLQALETGHIDYVLCRFLPHTHKLVPHDLDLSQYENTDQMPEIQVPQNRLIMVCGATLMNVVAKERGWVPGTFLNENFHYTKWKEHWGDNLLNSIAVVGELATLEIPWADTYMFIRPCEDTKAFTGLVIHESDFPAWRREILSTGRDPKWLGPKTMVVASPHQDILAEYRFFVVDGRICTGSMYKLGNRVTYDAYVNPIVSDFAKQMIQQWQPSRGFVIDIAETAEGPKIIEINNLNSSGFYCCDVSKIVQTIEQMGF
jgi:hypothetical protein